MRERYRFRLKEWNCVIRPAPGAHRRDHLAHMIAVGKITRNVRTLRTRDQTDRQCCQNDRARQIEIIAILGACGLTLNALSSIERYLLCLSFRCKNSAAI